MNLNEKIKNFAETISNQELGLVQYRPEEWARPGYCFNNVKSKVLKSGGRIQYGWMFHHRVIASIDGPGYLIAVHHAVWHHPSGQLIDVTPFNNNPLHHPYSTDKGVLFLVDDSAKPVMEVAPLASRFYPLSGEKQMLDYVDSLIEKESLYCSQQYEAIMKAIDSGEVKVSQTID